MFLLTQRPRVMEGLDAAVTPCKLVDLYRPISYTVVSEYKDTTVIKVMLSIVKIEFRTSCLCL